MCSSNLSPSYQHIVSDTSNFLQHFVYFCRKQYQKIDLNRLKLGI